MRNLKKQIHKKGFTLIEMLVSVALFSVVLTVALGSIMTIADSNKKARSLMSVTNNLNFAVDSMIRSFKTGDANNFVITNGANCDSGFSTTEIDYSQSGFDTRDVTYCFDQNSGKLTKDINGNGPVDLISEDVDIEYLEFIDSSIGTQPMLTIVIQGKVKVSERVSSEFSIQTSVSQRKLKI